MPPERPAPRVTSALHLPSLPPGYDRAARQLAALSRYLRAGPMRGCVSRAAVGRYARKVLARYGFTSWRITYPWGVTPPKGFARGGCWEAQTDSAAHAIQILPEPGFTTPPADVGPERVIGKTLIASKAACAPGSKPQNSAVVSRQLRTALRQAGYGSWRVVVNRKASASAPCYQQVEFPLPNHMVLISPTAFRR